MFPLREKSNTLVSFRKTRDKDAPPLRLGVIIDGSQPARWIEELLTLLRELPGFEVRLISLRQQQPATAMKNLPWLTDRVYTASKRKFDPFGLVSGNISESLEVSSIDDIGALGCGALLWLAEVDISNVDFRRHTEYGAFRVRFGKNNRGIPFWDEVARNEVTSCVKIYWHESSLDRGRLVRTAETSTVQGLFLTLNAEEPLAATIRTLADLCLCIRDDERQFIERLRGIPVDAAQACDTPDYPSNIEAASFVFKKLTRSAGLRWSAKGKEGKWFLVARPNSGVSISDSDGLNLGGFQEVVFPGEIQAADPFLCENNGRDFLFFEELATGTSRGRIGYVEVLGNGEYSEMSIVLEKDYHLSYPCIVPANGE